MGLGDCIIHGLPKSHIPYPKSQQYNIIKFTTDNQKSCRIINTATLMTETILLDCGSHTYYSYL